VGPADILEISVTRGPTQEKIQAVVRPSGTVMVLLAEVKVDGLTTDQAAAAIARELSVFFRNPTVDVQVKEYHSKKVTVFGAIGAQARASANTIPLTGRVTLMEAIAKAGGFHQNASLDRVRVSRTSGKTYTVNVFRFLQDGDLSQEFVLDAGDAVFVPEQVKGEERHLLTETPPPYFRIRWPSHRAAVGDGRMPRATTRRPSLIGGWVTGRRSTPAPALGRDRRIDQYLSPTCGLRPADAGRELECLHRPDPSDVRSSQPTTLHDPLDQGAQGVLGGGKATACHSTI
jgi:polysaccharide export outer membrane protein